MLLSISIIFGVLYLFHLLTIISTRIDKDAIAFAVISSPFICAAFVISVWHQSIILGIIFLVLSLILLLLALLNMRPI